MSGGGRGSGGGGGRPRVSTSSAARSTTTPSSSSIPNSTMKTIQHIMDITENHSVDEVYAMLKACSMDPNETVTKLLRQDTFHEVKRKRDKKKDNATKEPGESKMKPATQIRANHTVRPGVPPRYASHDSGGRNAFAGRDNGASQTAEKEIVKEKKESNVTASSVVGTVNGSVLDVFENASLVESSSAANGGKKQDSSTTPATMIARNEIPQTYIPPLQFSMPTFSTSSKLSTEDPVLLPSNESRIPGGAAAIKREIGINRNIVETHSKSNVEKTGKLSTKSQGYLRASESPHATSASVNRPLSNYGTRSQQIGVQKAGVNKEWKPKLIASTVPQSLPAPSSESCGSSIESITIQQHEISNLDDETSKLGKKIEDLHIPPRQHVIIPNHIHVPEPDRFKLSFGSFDANFGVSSYENVEESEKNSTPSDVTQVEESAEEHSSSNPNPSESSEEVNYSDPTHDPTKVSGSLAPSFENSDTQMLEPSPLPNFVVQQPFDPASYYSQYYRTNPDSDGRVSPFPTGFNSKINGVTVLPPSATSQEGGNSFVLTPASPTTVVTQPTSLLQSSIAMNQQQPLPLFRPPTGLHISHYPPNYIPYGHYFSPFYIPPPGIHQFLNNGSFPQQPQPTNLHPSPPPPTIPAKYSFPQQKPATNTSSGYGYGTSSNYNLGSVSTGGTTPTNEDLAKEKCVYIAGQQSEGSAMWVAAAGRDLSTLPANSFYNIPPQGQVAFAPPQGSHGGFYQGVTAAAVHPLLQQSQTTVDMVAPPASVYQQAQHQPINWPTNY